MIQIKDVKKVYGSGPVKVEALSKINLNVSGKEFMAIIGPSGSGKSTLMNIIGCIDRPTEGTYLLDDIDVSNFSDEELAHIRNKKIGFVFQMFNLLPSQTALENVQLPLLYSGINKKDRRERGLSMLQKMGLEGRWHHHPNELSGGECQRVAIARALINNPSIVLADEPTGNLDTKNGMEILNLFKRLNSDEGVTLIMVTHNPEIANEARRRIFIRDGMIEEDVSF
ncbi:MAG: ABC transporter ATP-binding protein [Nitrospirae bacterium]|nr:ABC transporter ATP-binding protein [Nitrospirota bacterium]